MFWKKKDTNLNLFIGKFSKDTIKHNPELIKSLYKKKLETQRDVVNNYKSKVDYAGVRLTLRSAPKGVVKKIENAYKRAVEEFINDYSRFIPHMPEVYISVNEVELELLVDTIEEAVKEREKNKKEYNKQKSILIFMEAECKRIVGEVI